MNIYLFVLTSLIISSIVYLKLAEYFNIIDNPNERSSHTVPIVRGGGILFYLGVVFFFISSDFRYPYFFSGLSILSLISFVDDIKSLSSRLRFSFQFIGVGLILLEINMSFAFLALLIIPCVGYINISNFMDGINGITGMYSIVVITGFYVLNLLHPFLAYPDLMIYSLLALVVFGYYNFRKTARFFAGDVGSISIAAIIMFLIFKALTVLQAPIILAMVFIFVIDAVLTMKKRVKLKENLSKPHRRHLYQVLVDNTKMSHMLISMLYGVTQAFIIILVIVTIKAPLWLQLSMLLLIILSLVIIHSYILKKVNEKIVN